MPRVESCLVKRALSREETECGDTGVIKEFDGQCFLALVDVLGHGREAHEVALMAQTYLEQNCREEPGDVMKGLHSCLKGTRGAVAAICRLNTETGELTSVGIGNITVRVLGPRAFRLISGDGIVGYMISSVRKHVSKLFAGDVLVMYSDGIREHFELYECAGLLTGGAKTIATGLLKQFGKENDDAACIVLRYLGV
jgi:phosphoserine phosphatase RsbX